VLKPLLAFLVFVPGFLMAQNVIVKGVIRDDKGQGLPQSHIIVFPDSIFSVTNSEGQFLIKTTLGEKHLQVTYVGFEIFERVITVKKDTVLAISLKGKTSQLQEVVISGTRDPLQEIFDDNQTSKHVLSQDDINAIPVLGGEADVIKTLQLLPGTVRGIEGSSDLFVRGGAADQNLVLLDDAQIYNTSHLFGFLSVFNADILDHVEAINGGFPAEYGGRLSSILNVQTKSGIPERTSLSGDIGLIASRLFLEQPIVKDKASFWLAGRRTYIDQVIRATGEELPYHFYDFNGKFLFRPTSRDEIQFSHYSGEDLLDLFRDRNGDGDGFLTTYGSGNSSQSLRWNREVGNNWYSSVALTRTKYRYNVHNAFEENQLFAVSDIEDYGARVLFQKDSVGKGRIRTGVDWTHHEVSPNVINTSGTITELLKSSSTRGRTADEFAVHFQYEWMPGERIQMSPGLRVSSAVVANRNYVFPEPRISIRYSLNTDEALKLSYSRMVQYMHRISNSAVSSPTDIWYPVTDSIQPQNAHQFALAWQRKVSNENILLSVEGYYKSMRQLIGYEEGTNLFLNTDFESKLIQGKGKAYGVEVLLRKNAGKLTGWISYTLSWSHRQFDDINGGKWFPSRYDRRHNGAIVAQYAFNKRWALSMVWEYISGSRFTPVIGQYVLLAPTLTGADLIPVYSGINQVKLASSHRLDIGLKFKSRPGRKFQWQWFAGIYNVYNRANPIGINIEQDEITGTLKYTQPGLFGLIPFLSYGFKI
jgi:outer membrane cobalamin receptor